MNGAQLFVCEKRGRRKRRKGSLRNFSPPLSCSAPLFHCPPIVSKVVTRTICSLRCSRRPTATAKRQGFPPDRRFRTLFAPRGGVQTTCQKLQLCSFTPFLRHEGVWPGRIIAHSASKSLAAHSPVCRRSLLQKTDQNNRRRER